MRRYNDNQTIDFSKLDTELDVHFAHARVIAKLQLLKPND